MEKKTRYFMVVEWIRDKIKQNELRPGDKLYSENELSKMLGLSRETIRHATGILEKEGLLRRVKGSGTYINDDRNSISAARNRIAVVTTYVDSYIFPRTLQGIEKTLSSRGYPVQIAFTNNRVEKERDILTDIMEWDDVAGIIIETTRSALPNPNLHLYRKLLDKQISVLFINSYYPGLEIPHVSLNDTQAAEAATDYLIGKGHTAVGGMFKLDDGQGHKRYAGYRKAMEAAGLATPDSRVVWLDTEDLLQFELSSGKYLKRLADCTAVLCYNDEVAFKLITLLESAGRRVPEDISVMGIDDSELSQLADLKLTSVPHPGERLGEKAAENLLAMLQSRSFDANYEFEASVVERESVRTL